MSSRTPDNKRLTTTAGAPVADNQNSLTAGPLGPLLVQDYQLIEKLAHQNRERIPERTVHAKGWGAYGTLTVTHDITRYHIRRHLLGRRQEDRDAGALLHRRRRARRRRPRARRARLRAEVLYRGRQLGSGRQQHAGVLRARPLQVPRLHPHAEAPPEDQPALAHGDVGFLVAVAGEPAPGDDPVLRSRHPALAALHARLRLAHLLVHQRGGRAPLGEVPLQDPAGHRDSTPTARRRTSSGARASPTRPTCSGRSRAATSPSGPCTCR